MDNTKRLIFHIDVNSAYLSWEAVRRVKNGEDDLRLIPSAIGGDREKRTGIILAKSIPAKKYGIRTGEPVTQALRKCPELVLARPDFSLYLQNSKAFLSVCREYAPVVEQYSIDECFLDMSGTEKLYPDPVATAHLIKDRIRDELGFTVNVGIGRCKLTAKMASDFTKPDRVHTLFPEEIPYKMWPLPVRELLFVGRSAAEKLNKGQILTIGDLAHADLQTIRRLIGVKAGTQAHAYANGIDDSPVLAEREEAKGYSISTTTETDVIEMSEARKILMKLCDTVASRMRSDGTKACCIGISIRSNTFHNHSHQKKLLNATDVTDEICSVVFQLFSELWDGRTPLRLLGVSLTQLTRDDFEQISLFPDRKKEKSRKLDKALDQIRSKYGMDAVMRANLTNTKIVGAKYRAQMDRDGKSTGGS